MLNICDATKFNTRCCGNNFGSCLCICHGICQHPLLQRFGISHREVDANLRLCSPLHEGRQEFSNKILVDRQFHAQLVRRRISDVLLAAIFILSLIRDSELNSLEIGPW